MTGRVCPVHGEYAPDGVCRWCEKPSGADQSAITLPLLCMCQKCGRGFDAPVPLTSLLCPECRATAPEAIMLPPAGVRFSVPMPLEPRKVHPNVPKGSMFCRCGEYAWAPWCPADERDAVIAGVAHSPEQCFKLDAEPPAPRYPLLNYLPPEYDHTEAIIDAETHAAEESRLLAQHAALRWERVARRWATKAKFDGHERTVDGTLAFDDRCAECRRLGHRGNRIAAQEAKP